jgi:hypothetical protein
MLTILLFLLFCVLIGAGVVLAAASVRQQHCDEPSEPVKPATSRYDPFAPILRAGLDTDDATTVRILARH